MIIKQQVNYAKSDFFNSHEGLEVDAKIKQVKLSLKKAHIIEEYAKQKRYIY